jgi:hypothetical protein
VYYTDGVCCYVTAFSSTPNKHKTLISQKLQEEKFCCHIPYTPPFSSIIAVAMAVLGVTTEPARPHGTCEIL